MKQEIIEKTYELIDEIKSSSDYRELVKLKQDMKENSEILQLIENFGQLNDKFNEVSKYGQYHPDLKKVQVELSAAKETLYNHKTVKEYKILEKKLQKIMDHISMSLAKTVSHKIKHPNEFGLISKK